MRVLVTGAGGLLGGEFFRSMSRDHEVFGLSSKNRNNFEFVLDLTKKCCVKSFFARNEFDLVINCAALASVELCEKDPALARALNAKIPRILAEQCALLKVKLVHISTDHIFDGIEGFYSESDIPFPVNNYGSTKKEGEDAVADICPDGLIVRTNFFGKSYGSKKSFSEWILSQLIANKEIHLFEDAFFSPLSMIELVKYCSLLVNRRASGVYHMGCGERVSKFEFGLRLASAYGLPTELLKRASMTSRIDLCRRPRDISLSSAKLLSFIPDEYVGGLKGQIDCCRRQD